MVKNLPAMQETQVGSLGQEDPLEKGMATHSSILAWRIPWSEEPGGLQPTGSQRVRNTTERLTLHFTSPRNPDPPWFMDRGEELTGQSGTWKGGVRGRWQGGVVNVVQRKPSVDSSPRPRRYCVPCLCSLQVPGAEEALGNRVNVRAGPVIAFNPL